MVEDDENLNRGITFSLKKSGYEVFSAESVKKAKRIASDNNCLLYTSSDDSFTDDNTAWQEKESIGKYACIMMEGTPQQAGFLTTFATSNPDAAYIAIDGPDVYKRQPQSRPLQIVGLLECLS